jgi:putative membrane-bound dehydrogenase-like protein
MFLFLGSFARSAEPAETRDPLAMFQVEKGFRIELVAGDTLVTAPVAMAFDENGRLFVAEMPDPSESPATSTTRGRIRLLEDSQGTGRFDRAIDFADDLSRPSALACYGGGVFVASTPQILYLRTGAGPQRPDLHRVVLSGFGGTNASPSQPLLHSFNWGLDNRIHLGTAGLEGMIAPPAARPDMLFAMAGHDCSFEPRTFALEAEAGPSQSGLSFDSRGRKFLCDFTHPLRQAMYKPRYRARNLFFAAPPELLESACPSTAIFRFSDSPKPANEKQPSTGANPLVSEWLKSARGCVVYRGSAFPTNYFENVFVADPEVRVIHRFVLRENGLETVAERAPGEQNTEFLISKDPAFRPVQIINGPDGALYVADHRTGGENGRIYRIVPVTFQQPKPPRLGSAVTRDLVAALAHPDGWYRDTAARLLFEQRDPAAEGFLTNVLCRAKLPQARLQALHALDGLGALKEGHVLQGLRDPDERVREHAVALAEKIAGLGPVSQDLSTQLGAMVVDPSIHVRYQLAFTLGEFFQRGRADALAALIKRDLLNPWIRAAVFSSLNDGAADFLARLARDAWFRNDPYGRQFLQLVAVMIGTRGRLDDVTQMLGFARQTALDPLTAYTLLASLGEGLHRTQSSLALVDPQLRLEPFYLTASSAAANEATPLPLRLEAIRLLGVSPNAYTNAGDWLLTLLAPPEPPAVRFAALAAVGRLEPARVAADLLQRWPSFTPALRGEAVGILLSRSDRVSAVMSALESGKMSVSDLSSIQINFLRTYHDPEISRRAVRLLGPLPLPQPAKVAAAQPALRLKGAAARGQGIYLARCAVCHRLGTEGQSFGPDLAGARAKGKEYLLRAIVEPNRLVAPEYAACVAETKEGENLVGIKSEQNGATLTLRQPNSAAAVWPLANIQSMQTQPWSLMPVGLEEGLSFQEIADLLDYIMVTPH